MSEGAIGQIVKEANQEVNAHGLEVSVLIRFDNLRDETNEQTVFHSLPHMVKHGRYGQGTIERRRNYFPQQCKNCGTRRHR